MAAQYTPRLTRLIQSLRTDLKSPNSLFVMGLVNPEDGAFTKVGQVQASQRQVQQTVANTLLIPTEGLGKLYDRVHYDARGQMELGKRFAQAYIQRTKGTPPTQAGRHANGVAWVQQPAQMFEGNPTALRLP